MKFQARGFSNIALIKYMGKSEVKVNNPVNASLSLTLKDLYTEVELEILPSGDQAFKAGEKQLQDTFNNKINNQINNSFNNQNNDQINDRLTDQLNAQGSSQCNDRWEALKGSSLLPLSMTEASIKKYLKFFTLLKAEFGIEEKFIIRSANNFPADCGIASSASSFSALTKAFGLYLEHRNQKQSNLVLALLSKKGSGSSCRSFFAPWAIWKNNEVYQADYHFVPGFHQVVIVNEKSKKVSSSEAHLLVASSSHFQGRKERAELRLQQLNVLFENEFAGNANNKLQWQSAFKICWDEFMDMHHLFHTAEKPFFYWSEATITALKYIADFWKENEDGPLVTMDAGPNLHFIYRKDQFEIKNKIFKELSLNYQIKETIFNEGV